MDKIPAMPDGISRSADGASGSAASCVYLTLPRLLAPYRRVRTLVSHIVGPLLPVVAKGPRASSSRWRFTGKPADAQRDGFVQIAAPARSTGRAASQRIFSSAR